MIGRAFTKARQARKDAAPETQDPARALVEYAQRGDTAKVGALLARGVDPNAEVWIDITVDTICESALNAAAENGHVETARTLLDAGAKPDKRVDGGYTPLISAAAAGKPGVIELLAARGADLNAREEIFGHTALHKAARLAQESAVSALLAVGADPAVRDDAGLLPEETACDQVSGAQQSIAPAIRGLFAAAAAADRQRRDDAAAARLAMAVALEKSPVLQRDLKPMKPLRFSPPK